MKIVYPRDASESDVVSLRSLVYSWRVDTGNLDGDADIGFLYPTSARSLKCEMHIHIIQYILYYHNYYNMIKTTIPTFQIV